MKIKLLQGRLFSYPDTAASHRLGANYMRIPVNCHMPVHNNQQDGFMTTTRQAATINYRPNRYDDSQRKSSLQGKVDKFFTVIVWEQKIEKPNDFKQAGGKISKLLRRRETSIDQKPNS
ncbi:catalase [Bacillus sp. SL00103]